MESRSQRGIQRERLAAGPQGSQAREELDPSRKPGAASWLDTSGSKQPLVIAGTAEPGVHLKGDLNAFNRGSRALFGAELSPGAVGELVGAPPNALIHVRWDADVYKPRIDVEHPLFTRWQGSKGMSFTFQQHERDGNIALEPLWLGIPKEAPPGTGTWVFSRMVEGARGLDRKLREADAPARLTALRLEASGPELGHNGYYTWARLGADGPFWTDEELPPKLAKARMLSDLMMAPGGAEWWRKHGEGVLLTFDLDPRSRSSRVLDDYARARSDLIPAVERYVRKVSEYGPGVFGGIR